MHRRVVRREAERVAGARQMSRSRSGRGSVISRPRMPRPSGRSPIAASRSSASTPSVMNWPSRAVGADHAERAVAGVGERDRRPRRCGAACCAGRGRCRCRRPRRAGAQALAAGQHLADAVEHLLQHCVEPDPAAQRCAGLQAVRLPRRSYAGTFGPWRAVAAGERVIRVFLLDDHEVVRRGLRELLEAEGDIEVVGESGLGAGGRPPDPGAAARRRGPRRPAAGRLRHRRLPRDPLAATPRSRR